MLLALSPKAHIALVSLPLFYWCCCHCCVVNTNVGTRMIVCIGTHGPLHPFAVVRDLVFDRGLDCNANATLKLSRACFHNGCSCNAFASLAVVNTLRVIVPSILAKHCLCGPCIVGHHILKSEEKYPRFGFVLGLPSPWGFFLWALPPSLAWRHCPRTLHHSLALGCNRVAFSLSSSQ